MVSKKIMAGSESLPQGAVSGKLFIVRTEGKNIYLLTQEGAKRT
jgi:hypothetical protein